MALDVSGKVQLVRVLRLTLGVLELLAGLWSGVLAARLFAAAVKEPEGYMANKILVMWVASSAFAVLLVVPGTMMLMNRQGKWWVQLPPTIALPFLIKDLLD